MRPVSRLLTTTTIVLYVLTVPPLVDAQTKPITYSDNCNTITVEERYKDAQGGYIIVLSEGERQVSPPTHGLYPGNAGTKQHTLPKEALHVGRNDYRIDVRYLGRDYTFFGEIQCSPDELGSPTAPTSQAGPSGQPPRPGLTPSATAPAPVPESPTPTPNAGPTSRFETPTPETPRAIVDPISTSQLKGTPTTGAPSKPSSSPAPATAEASTATAERVSQPPSPSPGSPDATPRSSIDPSPPFQMPWPGWRSPAPSPLPPTASTPDNPAAAPQPPESRPEPDRDKSDRAGRWDPIRFLDDLATRILDGLDWAVDHIESLAEISLIKDDAPIAPENQVVPELGEPGEPPDFPSPKPNWSREAKVLALLLSAILVLLLLRRFRSLLARFMGKIRMWRLGVPILGHFVTDTASGVRWGELLSRGEQFVSLLNNGREVWIFLLRKIGLQ